MVSVAKKTWLICGYHGLTIVIIVFGFIVKSSLIFVRVVLLSALAPSKPIIKRYGSLSATLLL